MLGRRVTVVSLQLVVVGWSLLVSGGVVLNVTFFEVHGYRPLIVTQVVSIGSLS